MHKYPYRNKKNEEKHAIYTYSLFVFINNFVYVIVGVMITKKKRKINNNRICVYLNSHDICFYLHFKFLLKKIIQIMKTKQN